MYDCDNALLRHGSDDFSSRRCLLDTERHRVAQEIDLERERRGRWTALLRQLTGWCLVHEPLCGELVWLHVEAKSWYPPPTLEDR